ncbi:CHRromatin Organization modifier domain-containing protein [Echria macrotheca]|uniref:CHRromatin Organization modifier domain-containing protein n=1 Tax=Echria macrotheca TaxID=438768 RepID=A0AAJ0BBZ4_9PEZI|nr:CHRromatin Organization modifier domain-containing protein [Echria macrotheca]
MPYDLDQPLEEDYQFVQSDLVGKDEPEPTGAGASAPTVVALESESGAEADDFMPAPVADMGEADGVMKTPASGVKKRGRPSRSASATPAAKPSAKTATPAKSTGRKRKAEDDETQTKPAAKRGRPARTTALVASARLSLKAANKPKRGRPKGSETAPAEKAPKRAGRPKKTGATSNGVVPSGEFEVEAIVESQIDADTMEHMYLVKWKGYSSEENTWEPRKNLSHATELVKAFEAKKKRIKTEAAPAAAPKPRGRPGRKPKAKA